MFHASQSRLTIETFQKCNASNLCVWENCQRNRNLDHGGHNQCHGKKWQQAVELHSISRNHRYYFEIDSYGSFAVIDGFLRRSCCAPSTTLPMCWMWLRTSLPSSASSSTTPPTLPFQRSTAAHTRSHSATLRTLIHTELRCAMLWRAAPYRALCHVTPRHTMLQHLCVARHGLLGRYSSMHYRSGDFQLAGKSRLDGGLTTSNSQAIHARRWINSGPA